MTVVQIVFRRFGKLLLAAGAAGALVGAALLALLPDSPAYLWFLPRLVLAVCLVAGIQILISTLTLMISKKSTIQKEIEESPMPWPLPVYEHLFRTRMPRDLKEKLSANRANEIRRLESFIESEDTLLFITGEPGIGKSSLAALITRRADFWLNLHYRSHGLRDILFHLASWLELPFVTDQLLSKRRIGEEIISTILHALSKDGRRMTFNGFDHLLDGQGKMRDEKLEQFFNRLLLFPGDHKVIICSEYEPDIHVVDAHVLPVPPLDEREIAGLIEQDYVCEDQRLLRAIARESEGNPLRLQLLLPFIMEKGLESAELERESSRIVNGKFIAGACGAALPVLQKVALMPEPLTRSFIGSMQPDSGGVAESLKDAGLLVWDGGMKRYYCHPAVIDAVFSTLPGNNEELPAIYLELAQICVKKAEDFKAPAKWAGISDCRLYLYAVGLYLRAGRAASAADLLFRVQPYLEKWGHQLFLIRHYERLLRSFEVSAPEPTLQIRVFKVMISLYLSSGSPERAEPLVNILERLAMLENDGALTRYVKGKKMETLVALGQFENAESLAATLFKGEQDAFMAADLARLGHLYKARGDNRSAARQYQKSAVLFKQLGQKTPMLKSIEYLAEAHLLAGDYQKSRELLEKLLAKDEIQSDTGRLLRIQHLRVSACVGMKDYAKAVLVLKESSEKAESGGEEAHWVNSILATANLYANEGNLPAAIDHLEKLEVLATRRGDLKSAGIGSGKAARLLLKMNKPEEAVEKARQAERSFEACAAVELEEKAAALAKEIQSTRHLVT